jgi:hypothetical protein
MLINLQKFVNVVAADFDEVIIFFGGSGGKTDIAGDIVKDLKKSQKIILILLENYP